MRSSLAAVVARACLVALGGLLGVIAVLSLRWRFQHDCPIFLYISFLIDRFGMVPYRDILDVNMPGTHAAYFLIGRLSGYTDLGARLVDLAILTAMSAMSWIWLRRLNREVAWCGAMLWGLIYLGMGPDTSLQRDYLALLPLVAGVFVGNSLRKPGVAWRSALAGVLFGIAGTLRPHAVIGLPVVLWFEYLELREAGAIGRDLRAPLLRMLLPAAGGFLVPMLAMVLFLWATGAWAPFLDVAANYWPLYTHLTELHETISREDRPLYLVRQFLLMGGYRALVIPGLLGLVIALRYSGLNRSQKRQALLLATLTLCYSLYPVIGGQFWQYHWLPFLFFVSQLSALALVEWRERSHWIQRGAPFVLLFAIWGTELPYNWRVILSGDELSPPKEGKVDAIATFLQENLRPGDTVQPLDWTGGAAHAMLLAKAKIATPFVYDVYFYHHVSNPYIQSLRRTFLTDMKAARPRFVVEITGEDKPWVSGADTTREFPELAALLERDYRVAVSGRGYVIYEIRDDGSTALAQPSRRRYSGEDDLRREDAQMAHIELPEGLPGIVGPMIAYPETEKHLNGLADALLRGRSSLTPGEREMIAAFVSKGNECSFCAQLHASTARHLLGIASPMVDSVLSHGAQAPVSEKLQALLEIAGKVRQDGRLVTEEDVARARKAGADDKAIHDTVLIAAAFSMYTRYVDGLATWAPQEPELYDEMAAQLAENGYAKTIRGNF
jgi:uncharacterized peroxidase-related enzyme